MAVPVIPESLLYRRKKFWKVMVARVFDSRSTLTPSFGFNGLVQTLVVTAAVHQAAGEFIDDDDPDRP